jgi:RNA polymerase sigma-B factor
VSAVRQPAETEHSGRLLLRMPRALHGELAQAAEREGVSLNRLIVSRLSGSPATPVQPSRSRFLGYALIVNFAVLLVTGATAVVLLVAAYR